MTTLEHRIELPELYPAQHRAFFNDARYAITEACTKAGKTVGALAWQIDRVAGDTLGREHWWVAPVYGQALIAYKRAKRILSPLISAGVASAQLTGGANNVPNITLANGATWQFRSAEKPDNLYGEDVADAVFDEFTRAREESWHAVRSTLTRTEGPVRLIGNVRGRGWGWRLARMAENGTPGMVYSKIVADDAIEAGILKAEEIEDARRILPEAVFRELYYCEPADDGANPFGLNAIAACVAPESAGEPVAWGVDLARSQDWTVAIALDATGAVCRFERWQAPWGATRARLVGMIGDTPAEVDSTGVGSPVTEDLQRECKRVSAFVFTAQSKQAIMERLAAAIQGGEITYPDSEIRRELEAFEYEYTRTGVRYSAPSGLHDDCVCALALAVKLWASERHRPAFSFGFATVGGRA